MSSAHDAAASATSGPAHPEGESFDDRAMAPEPAPPSVLVVDDTEGNRYVVARLLRAAGMRVSEAANGREALDLVAERSPDLVVLDINLPDITGYEVCRIIKGDPATAFIPVMHLSASYVADADRAYGLDAGADAYLTHPIDPALLLATTRALLRASHAEAAFRRAALEWRTTFDAIADAIFLIEASGVVRRCNRAAADLVRRHPHALIGRTWEQVVGELDAGRPDVLRSLTHAPAVRDIELLVRGRWWNLSSNRAADEGSTAQLVVCVLSDITTQKRAREERDALLERTESALRDAEAARLEAETASRAKSDFLAVMSHELRTPLNAIAGFTELISLGIRGPVTGAQLADLERIRRSQVTLLALINALLSLAKLESGSVRYEIVEIVADEALASAGEFVEAQLRTKGLHFVHEPSASAMVLCADPEKLQQILLNLLSNAVKFTEAGGTITLRCERSDGRVHLRVSDTGAGIPADKLATIFDPFVQVDQRLTREHQGVGLGLAISRNLALGMNGELDVSSVVGEGSTFTLSLPAPR